MNARDCTKDLKTAPAVRIGALVLAFALSALTLGAAMPGGAEYVASRLMPDAGNAYETIASRGATEVEILPKRIDVIGVRAQADASPKALPRHG